MTDSMDDELFPENFLDETDSVNESAEKDDNSLSMDVDEEPPEEDNSSTVDNAPGVPNKAAVDLTRNEIRKIIKVENESGSTYLFAVSKKKTCFVFLHYGCGGDKSAALKAPACQFVRCTTCDDLLQSRGGHLGRHQKKHEGSSSKPSTPTSTGIQQYLTEELSKDERRQISALLAKYALDAGAPFRSLESEPIQSLVVELINFGARRKSKGGSVSVNAILPCRTTIATYTTALANQRITKASSMLEPFREHGGAVSLDYGKRVDHYLAVCCHFIEPTSEGWKLRVLPVGFEPSDGEDKVAAQVYLDLLDAIELVGLKEEHIAGTFCVTDEGSNVCSMAKERFKAIRCAAHVMNTMAKRIVVPYDRIVKQGTLSYDELQLIKSAKQALDAAETISHNIRGTRKIVALLEHKPSIGSFTRWLSTLNVCRDMKQCLDQLVGLKQDPVWSKRMGKVVVDAITELNSMRNELDACINVLAPFEEAVTVLQADTKPTIHLVWKYVLQIRKEMQDTFNNEQNSDMVRALAHNALLVIEFKLSEGFITDAHKIAAFLNPKTRRLRHLSWAEKNEIHAMVRREIEKNAPPVTQSSQAAHHPQDQTDLLEDEPDQRPETDELDSYLNAYFAETDSSVFDLMEFWTAHEGQFPGLAAVAMKFLAIPATSAACERAFRRLKLLIPDSREALKSTTVTKLMLARHY